MAENEAKVLDVLEKITGAPEVRSNLDLDLFDEPLLDSLGLVELIVALSDEFAFLCLRRGRAQRVVYAAQNCRLR